MPRSSVRPSVRPIVCPPPPPSFLSCVRASVRPSLSRAYPRAHVCACALACISTAHTHTRAHMCTLTCGTYEHEHACALARTRALLPRRALCTPVALCSYACMVHAVATKAFFTFMRFNCWGFRSDGQLACMPWLVHTQTARSGRCRGIANSRRGRRSSEPNTAHWQPLSVTRPYTGRYISVYSPGTFRGACAHGAVGLTFHFMRASSAA